MLYLIIQYPLTTFELKMIDYWNSEILVLGCGNILFGDDGFGPAVVEYFLKNYEVPPETHVINAGLSVREILFTVVLSDTRPKRIIIVDAVDVDKTPGEIFELEISKIPDKKIDDFSMHQLPTLNLLRELKDLCSVDVKILSVQTQNIPDEVSPGLSEVVQRAIPIICDQIILLIEEI